MYAVSMARNLEVQVENKQVTHFKIPNWCTGTAKDIQNAYMKLHELCTTGINCLLVCPSMMCFIL